jgi:hypothetical protein
MKSTASTLATNHSIFLDRFRTFTPSTRKAAYIESIQSLLNHRHFTEINRHAIELLPEHTLDK